MAKPLRVLVIEDSEEDTLLLVRQLRQAGYEPAWKRVDGPESMAEALGEGPWDILISDHSLPHFNALKGLEIIKERGLDLPVIILSGTIDEAEAVAAMRAGASDFISKEHTARLLPAIERELREAEARRAARQVSEQFRQSQKLEAVGRLAGGVAHDFNNLLTTIMGNCEFLLEATAAGDPKRKDLEEIRAAGQKAAALTRQLLAFSRKQILQLKVLDLNAVVADSERLLRRLIGEDIALRVAMGKDLPPIKADPGQIEQVVMNLAVNARDAMPRGGKLTIATSNYVVDENHPRVEFDVKPGPHVMLSVSDTGCGMDETVRPRIFEPFFTTKELGKGTGLGLSTVYGIVKQSAGCVCVQSRPGEGTTFKICFPAASGPAEPLAKEAAPRSLKGSETILVVEDDEKVRALVKRILSSRGYLVLAAADGDEALRISAERRDAIHLVITDVVMPRMSGADLAREIRKSRPMAKVLYLSGYTDDVIAERGILKPGIRLLQKPFDADILCRRVREAIESAP
ncbi:MAG: response regulator [Elusimicrobia bacterium]|nr:response regulator [Elusimicrobiota bacterium]